MRRFRVLILAAAACVAVLAVASNASAGDFAEGPCSGEPAKLCPTATVGQSYSTTFTLKEPGDCGPIFAVSSGAFPPGLSLASDEGVARGTPTQAGRFSFYITVSYTLRAEERLRPAVHDQRQRRHTAQAEADGHDPEPAGREPQRAVHRAGPAGVG